MSIIFPLVLARKSLPFISIVLTEVLSCFIHLNDFKMLVCQHVLNFNDIYFKKSTFRSHFQYPLIKIVHIILLYIHTASSGKLYVIGGCSNSSWHLTIYPRDQSFYCLPSNDCSLKITLREINLINVCKTVSWITWRWLYYDWVLFLFWADAFLSSFHICL